MKSIIMAAGYATRLYPLTENFPKPLLRIGDNTILGRLLDDLDTIPHIDAHIIVTNHKFAGIFTDWAAERKAGTGGKVSAPSESESDCAASNPSVGSDNPIGRPSAGTVGKTPKPITVIDDGTSTNETRLGAVRDLLLAIDSCGIDEDILVAAADNLLDFSLSGFVDYFRKRRTSMIMCHHEPEIWRLQRTGVIRVDNDENLRVLEMQEKPQVPASHWAVPPFYIYRKEDLPLIRSIVSQPASAGPSADNASKSGKSSPAVDLARLFDAPGSLVKYLCRQVEIHAWPMAGHRFDIGSLDSYEEARKMFGDK